MERKLPFIAKQSGLLCPGHPEHQSMCIGSSIWPILLLNRSAYEHSDRPNESLPVPGCHRIICVILPSLQQRQCGLLISGLHKIKSVPNGEVCGTWTIVVRCVGLCVHCVLCVGVLCVCIVLCVGGCIVSVCIGLCVCVYCVYLCCVLSVCICLCLCVYVYVWPSSVKYKVMNLSWRNAISPQCCIVWRS
jgi:hypothetical protein